MTDASTLHPDLLAVAASLHEAGIAATPGADLSAARAHADRVNAFVTRGSRALADERLVAIGGPHGTIPAKLYWPDGARRPALLFYAHGGGFRQGALAGWDAPMRMLVRTSGMAVLSIDYRLAPEHRFPIAFDEVVQVMRKVILSGEVAGRDVAGFGAGGDSAGANLLLGAALALRDAGIGALRQLMLLYGVYSRDVSAPSWSEFGGFGLSPAAMQSVWANYLGNDETDWRAQPLHADLAGLPPVRLVVGALDPLIDENIALDTSLRASGVASTLTILPRVNHGVVRYAEVAPVVREMLQAEGAALRRAFA